MNFFLTGKDGKTIFDSVLAEGPDQFLWVTMLWTGNQSIGSEI